MELVEQQTFTAAVWTDCTFQLCIDLREKRHPRGRADALHVVRIEHHALARQLVDVLCVDLRWLTVELHTKAHIVEAEVYSSIRRRAYW